MRRKQILELLQLIASEESQLAYERDVPIANVSDELVCMWFDDLDPVRPSDDFTAPEREALEHFHYVYDGQLQRLPASQGRIQVWLDSPVWRTVMEQARQTLESIRFLSGCRSDSLPAIPSSLFRWPPAEP